MKNIKNKPGKQQATPNNSTRGDKSKDITKRM